MTCPKCGSENVNVSTETTQGKTKSRHKGIIYEICRWCLIVCTLGLWLVIGKRGKNSKTKFKNQTVAICQNCGHKWKV